MSKSLFFNCIFLLLSVNIIAQESINVTFKYEANESAIRAFVPGEFNNWGNNSSGVISRFDASLMNFDEVHGFWYKTIALEVGGGTATLDGKTGYAYKFHEHFNDSGTEWNWVTDPFNDATVGPNFDSFIEVTNPLIFQIGRENGLAGVDLDAWFAVASIESDPIDVVESKFYFNDQLSGNFENNYDKDRQLFYATDTENYNLVTGSNKLKIVAVTESGATVSDSLNFTYIGNPEDANKVRPAGLKDGITYNEAGTSVTFSLFAPYKKDIFMRGDFNDWKIDIDYKMFRDSVSTDSLYFWIEVDGLTPGEEYGFQYLVDGQILIADPYSELILNEFEDQFISEDVFPNLLDYPVGKTGFEVGVIRPGAPEYDWEVTSFEKPENDELVIYELLLRDFIADHSYSTLIDKLDYLENLGINAIELLPVNEFEGNESWGYNPSFHFALDKYYGTPNEFKRFVDEAHKRGIAVIVDVVLNHSFGRNPLVKLWNTGDFGNPTSENPYFNTTARHPFNVGYDFNHESEATRYYSKRVMEYWIEEYKVDGYRFDLSKGFTQRNNPDDVGAWGAYDQSRVNIWKDYSSHIWSIDPDAYVILEHFSDGSEETALANEGMMLWGNMNHEYNEASMGYNSNVSGVLSQNRGFNDRHLVGYMESHDEQWLMFKNRSFANSSGDYNIRSLPTALDRMELVGAFFYTLPGPKMIWQFGELGYGYGDNGEQCLNDSPDCPATAPGRTDNKPIRWDYYEDPDRKDVYNTWSELINLRRSSPAFTKPESSFYALSGLVKYVRYQHSDTDVVIIGNFDVNSTNQNVDFTTDGTWYDYFGATTIDVSGGVYNLDLAPGEFKIFTTKQFNMGTSNEEIADNDSPKSFRLHQNYPNPFNPTTNISFDVAKTGQVTLEVYDMLGRKVSTLVNGVRSIGSYTVSFDASSLSSGLYLVRLQAGNNVSTKKMTLLK